MTKPPKRSILASFAAYTATTTPTGDEALAGADMPYLANRVGAGVIGATQRSLSELREERDRLKATVSTGGSIEIDPNLIDPSPFPDRLPDDGDGDFTRFKELMASEGQLVPIQVRRRPDVPDRFQVIYGHRRWRAAKDLGLLVKAIVVAYDDRELAIAQGIENSARQDLTWIEKALFASRMEYADVKARDIRAALSIDDAELARFRSVTRSVPVEVVHMIGRAPKTGRPRWLEFAGACREGEALTRVRETLAAAKVSSSDERFLLAFDAARGDTASGEGARAGIEMKTRTGRTIGQVAFSRHSIRFNIVAEEAETFRIFVEAELTDLMDRYEASKQAH